jgi:hypothetical protein
MLVFAKSEGRSLGPQIVDIVFHKRALHPRGYEQIKLSARCR